MLRKTIVRLIGSATLSALTTVAPLIAHGADRTRPPRRAPQRNSAATSSDFKVQRGTRRLPDLRVTAFAVQRPKYVGSKLVVDFTIVVKNTGKKPTGSHFFNAIYLDKKVVWSGKSEALEPDGSHRINGAAQISDPGQEWARKTFRLVARCDARLIAGDTSVPAWAFVKENNEQNNRRKSVELTAPSSLGLTTNRSPAGARPAQRRTGRAGRSSSRLQTKVAPARAASANESGPRRTGGFVRATLWNDREIPTAGNSPLQLLELDKRVKQYIRNQGVPGMTIAITKDERLVYSRAFGYANLAEQIQMTPNHRSRIGSVSKILTTLAIMRLTELRDDFSLDTHVYGFDQALSNPLPSSGPFGGGTGLGAWADEFLAADGVLDDPEFFWAIMKGTPDPEQASAFARMTIRHLLTHTSGFQKTVPGTGQKRPMRDGHLVFLGREQLAYEPGTGTMYQNHNMGACGLLIRELSGMTYEGFCRKYILNKAGLPHVVINGTHVGWRDAAAHREVNGRYVVEEVKPHGLDFEVTGFSAGSWSATANDLVKLMCATDRSPNRIDVLHRSTLAEMESIPFPDARKSSGNGNQKPRAHGWGKGGNGVLAHSGSLPNRYTAYVAKYPPREKSRAAGLAGRSTGRPNASGRTGVNIAIAVNCEADKLNDLAKALEEMLSDAHIPIELDLF